MDSLKSTVRLWTALASTFRINQRNVTTFLRRANAEGLQFLSIDLPTLGKDLDRALITGNVFRITARFKKRRGTELPVFLYDLFSQVFTVDGRILESTDVDCIQHIRQLCLMYYKTEVTPNEEQMAQAIADFTSRDSQLSRRIPIDSPVLRRARGLIGEVLCAVDPRKAVPKHGSGAVSNRLANQDKYHNWRFIPKLNEFWPYSEYFFYNETHLCDELDRFLAAEEVVEPYSRLAAVPKDSRGPRLICCEPSEYQFIQQGLMRLIYRKVEEHPLTKGYVNFTDQSINQALVVQASLDGKLATLDLKDASDRVRLDLVEHLFPGNWVDAFKSCRSELVQLPDGTLFGPLRKFAPMGSGVCFPVEALVFWALIKGALGVDAWVYGDDIILPTDKAEEAIHVLETYDLQVNVAKSCYRTPFRESCGSDYYAGTDVGYVNCRRLMEDTIEAHVSAVQFANQCTLRYGFDETRKVRTVVDHQYGGHFTTELGSEQYEDIALTGANATCALAYIGDSTSPTNDANFRRRWNEELSRYEYLVPVIVSLDREYRSHSNYHWNEWFRKELIKGREHYDIGRYADPKRCTQKFRWRTASAVKHRCLFGEHHPSYAQA